MGAGSDSVSGTNAVDTVHGGGGHDSIWGLNGIDILYGGVGNDYFDGGGHVDIIYGGDGNDTVAVSGAGWHDTAFGGAGNDTIDNSLLTYATGNVHVDLAAGTWRFAGSTHNISDFENAIGSDFADTLTGSGGANVLSGGSGVPPRLAPFADSCASRTACCPGNTRSRQAARMLSIV